MIVKNEGANLERALKSVIDLVDELILVDTGSTDNTKEIAIKYRAKVYDFPWCDDFSAARNEALKHSTGDWILWIDGDEYFDKENQEKLSKLISSLKDENVAYIMDQVSTREDSPGDEFHSSRASLFRNRSDIRWKYRIHEQILSSVNASGGYGITTDIRICHTGYHDRAIDSRKAERDIYLLHLEDNENPNDPHVLFHLGLMYESLSRHIEGLPYWPRAIQLFKNDYSMIASTYYFWARGLYRLENIQQAIQICQEGLNRFPTHPQLLLLQAQMYAQIGQVASAEKCLRELIKGPAPGYTNISLSPGFYTFRPYAFLGTICTKTNRFEEAEQYFEKALEYNPIYDLALEGMAELRKVYRQDRQDRRG